MPNLIGFTGRYTPLKRMSLHLLFWICIALMYTISYNRLDKDNSWVLMLKDLFAIVTIFYTTAYIIIPRWLMRGNFILSIFWIVVIYLWWGVLTYLACFLLQEFMEPNKRLAMYVKMVLENGLAGLFNFPKLPFYILDFIYLVSLPLGLKVMQTFAKVRNQKTQLELENTELELAFLKSQVNPHFLFNTLNNIYILVTDNDPSGADYVTKLSGIMHYLLHESNRPTVPLSAEVKFLENYFDLEKLRISDSVSVEIEMELDSQRYNIVPLILFPFIENAFKHGPRSSMKNAWLKISLQAIEGTLQMEVSNGINYVPRTGHYVGGIGIVNVKKRLELNYKDAYRLDIDQKEDSYHVKLTLQLEVMD